MESAYSGKAGNIVAPASVAAHGYVNGRGPRDTSSAKQDAGDRGRDGADEVGGRGKLFRALRVSEELGLRMQRLSFRERL